MKKKLLSKLLCIAILTLISISSCKKEILIAEKKIKPKSSSAEATIISYTQFLKSVNISLLGLLKSI